MERVIWFFFTPEMLILNKKWQVLLLSKVYARNLRGIVIDEAHTVIIW